jgi:hypothetical protein
MSGVLNHGNQKSQAKRRPIPGHRYKLDSDEVPSSLTGIDKYFGAHVEKTRRLPAPSEQSKIQQGQCMAKLMTKALQVCIT